jgi:hypothetical protein
MIKKIILFILAIPVLFYVFSPGPKTLEYAQELGIWCCDE